MSEVLVSRNKIIAANVLTAVGLMALVGCGEPVPEEQGQSSEIERVKNEMIQRLEGRVNIDQCAQVVATDKDCDGTPDAYDLRPWQRDFIDSDSDFVTDRYDKYPGQNDYAYDSDRDGVIDAFDLHATVSDLIDSDGDGILNNVDSDIQIPQSSTTGNQDLRVSPEYQAHYIQVNEQIKAFYEHGDVTMFPDPGQNLFGDTDKDGTLDTFDIDPDNWMEGGDYDPYKVGSDAWYDDQDAWDY